MKIIAEVGSNINCVPDVITSIVRAKNCGADIVKFQHFTDEEMFGHSFGAEPLFEEGWIQSSDNKARAAGIEFCCTFFSPGKLEKYQHLLNHIKIASSDMLYTDLLDVAKASGKTILLSTGGHSSADVSRAVKYLKGADLVIMYCESAYPARCTDLRKLEILRSIHPRVGFSDHSTEIYSNPLRAKELGCEYIEKHVNFCGHKSTPDAPHSLDSREFHRMADAIKGKSPPITLRSPEEKEMVTRHIRRLVANKAIPKGTAFQYGVNFGQYRSIIDDTNGFPSYAWKAVDGKMAIRNIEPDESIGPKEVSL